MRAFLAIGLLALGVTLLSVAAAQPSAQDLTGSAGQVIDQVKDIVDNAPSDAAPAPVHKGPDLGAAFGAVGQFFAQVAAAIGTGVTVTATLVADSAVAAVTVLADASLASAQALASAAAGATDGVVASARGLGFATAFTLDASGRLMAAFASAAADGAAITGRALATAASAVGSGATAVGTTIVDAGAWLGAQLALLAGIYASFVGGLRPSKMPEPVFTGIVVAGSAATASAAAVGAWEAIRRYGFALGLPAMAGFSRIEDDELLKHPMRAQVFQVIQANPGIHASELARRMGAGWGTIVHHLDKLEKGQLVAVRKVNNQKCFFEMGGKISRVDMAIAGAVRSDSASQIAAFVQTHPMTSQKMMAEELGISPALASFHVKKLVHMGVLEKARQGKQTLLTTTESLRRVLAGESGAVLRPPVLASPILAT